MSEEIQSVLKKIDDKRYLLDVRGYSCPYPQLFLAKAFKAVQKDDVVEILTDNPPSTETLPKSIKNNKQQYIGTESIQPGVWKIVAKKVTA
ncbi:MAG: sulfurtransferase TusA family protein [Candidatus Caldarchaeum sp.]|nr:sulfurtransferase TusA family protein [Candidatus Caldarchaeum sp.]MCX8201464.1 sulfurtransferase TusA family protein [Candidatus Caldarchaeum sp.]MDW8435946.1 sulfurtransferase TusA family protein [Candidatus Caldarchaeum sp.]